MTTKLLDTLAEYIYIYIYIYIYTYPYIIYICNIRKLVVLVVINKYCWPEYAGELSYDVIEGTG